MAGSKTFLEPILKETVAGIDTSIQSMNQTMEGVKDSVDDVKESVDVVPSKIDDQIIELQTVVTKLDTVASSIGATAAKLNIASGTDIVADIYNNDISMVYGQTKTLNVKCNCSGVFKLYFEYMGGSSSYGTRAQVVVDGTTVLNLGDRKLPDWVVYEANIPAGVQTGDTLAIQFKNTASGTAWDNPHFRNIKAKYNLFNPLSDSPFSATLS